MEFTERNTIPELDAQRKEAITREWADVMIFIQRLNARRADFALTHARRDMGDARNQLLTQSRFISSATRPSLVPVVRDRVLTLT
jgi:hypothetical protein